MAIHIDSITKLQEYLQGVLGRADHHAKNVEGVALALLGAVIWKSNEIKVREYAGRPANMIWFKVGGKEYLMKYNHPSEQIELIDGATNVVLHNFDNLTTYTNILYIFNSL